MKTNRRIRRENDKITLEKLIVLSLIFHFIAFGIVLIMPSGDGEAKVLKITKVRLVEAPVMDAPFVGTPQKGPLQNAELKSPKGLKDMPVERPKAPDKIPDKITKVNPQNQGVNINKPKPEKKEKEDTGSPDAVS